MDFQRSSFKPALKIVFQSHCKIIYHKKKYSVVKEQGLKTSNFRQDLNEVKREKGDSFSSFLFKPNNEGNGGKKQSQCFLLVFLQEKSCFLWGQSSFVYKFVYSLIILQIKLITVIIRLVIKELGMKKYKRALGGVAGMFLILLVSFFGTGTTVDQDLKFLQILGFALMLGALPISIIASKIYSRYKKANEKI